ncbi:PLP-dependent aminotransferase family protein, partial [Rothia sp. AR01]
MPRYPADAEIPVRVDRAAGPIPGQIVEQVRHLLAAGALHPGDPIPSTRGLAERLGVSRGTVTTAYDQLAGEGYLVSDRGSTRINPDLPPSIARSAPADGSPTPPARPGARRPGPTPPAATGTRGRAPTPPARPGSCHPGPTPAATSAPTRAATPSPAPARPVAPVDLRPGTPDISSVANTAWRAAWRSAAAHPGLGYGPEGSAELRRELAEYLRLLRSVVASPEDLVVTAGARDGLRLLLTVLSRRHVRPLTVAVEDPGYPSLHRVPQALGHAVVPVPLDAQGLDPAGLPSGERRPDVVLLTPSHQYPLGTSMPVARRLELIRWAEEQDALLVEDDYDSELRYVGDPLPALAALDSREAGAGGRVVTLGSFAKTLTPGLGLGFVLLPPRIREEVLALRRDAGAPVSAVVQDAVAHYMRSGGFRRHTARMRRDYRRRRDMLARILDAGHLPSGVEVLPMDGGLHAVLRVPGPEDEARVLAALERAGIAVAALGEYWSRGRRAAEGIEAVRPTAGGAGAG